MSDAIDDESTGSASPTEFRSSAGRTPEPRFTPGTVLSDRYRIIALLGRGGMGEVYRADDIKLGQQVALKFLPRHAGSDSAHIARLYEEVRVGRQVSHPNVCRLYDIGEWDGNHFIAMEYVDGEDLASLLRRIGHLPEAKALDIARDICAGLAAAHGLGVIHRDLKPANIMLDGRGVARITDFGLAAFAEDLTDRREVVGTPAYMAPEQLKGGEITSRTDLYALGLILYELFTGKQRFTGKTFKEIAGQHSSASSHSVATETKGLDDAVQRVILRCLEEDPAQRPASIHSVIAALPGGDPLQAAIDAGETPSPEMVAAAGATGVIPIPLAWGLFVMVLVGLIAAAFLKPRNAVYGLVDLPKSPEFLRERTKEMLASIGYPSASDDAFSIELNRDYFTYIKEEVKTSRRWERLRTTRPGVMEFTYRQSPETLQPWRWEGKVWPDDPPATLAGMAEVRVDGSGRLIRFSAVPPQMAPAPLSPTQPDWRKLFELAQLDMTNFKPTVPLWSAPTDTEAKFAWNGFYSGQVKEPIRVEAASYRGKPVWFVVLGPWQKPFDPKARATAFRISDILFNVTFIVSIIVALFLARRNLKRGRGDRRGALRGATFIFVCSFVAGLLRRDHFTDLTLEWENISQAAAQALFSAVGLWVTYIAIEPYIRRQWPHVLISWNRLLAGRINDSMVGRDLLFGVLAGVVFFLCEISTLMAPSWFGGAPLTPLARWTSPLAEVRQFLYLIPRAMFESGITAVGLMAFLFVLFLIFRKRWIAATAFFLYIAIAANLRGENTAVELLFGVIIAAVAVLLLTRLGVLAFSVAIATQFLFEAAPITLDTSVWYFGRSTVALFAITGVAAFGFYRAVGERPLFGKPLLDD